MDITREECVVCSNTDERRSMTLKDEQWYCCGCVPREATEFSEEQVLAAFKEKRHIVPQCLNPECKRDLKLHQGWYELERVDFHVNNYATEQRCNDPEKMGDPYCGYCRCTYPQNTSALWRRMKATCCCHCGRKQEIPMPLLCPGCSKVIL